MNSWTTMILKLTVFNFDTAKKISANLIHVQASCCLLLETYTTCNAKQLFRVNTETLLKVLVKSNSWSKETFISIIDYVIVYSIFIMQYVIPHPYIQWSFLVSVAHYIQSSQILPTPRNKGGVKQETCSLHRMPKLYSKLLFLWPFLTPWR